jgi:RND family efflux transporter MFP subunit
MAAVLPRLTLPENPSMSSERSSPLPEVKLSPRRVHLVSLIGLIVFVVTAVTGIAVRVSSARSLRDWTETQAIPTVVVAKPESSSEGLPLELPATLDAFINAPIYAQVDGYLKVWNRDIGTQVMAGDLLGVVDTPDLDQQLRQAQADLASARASAALAAITSKRWQQLQKADPDSVSTQAVDQNNSDYAARLAQANAAAANLERLRAEKAFARLVAPFAGRVTARNTDIGELISSGRDGTPLFVVSDTSRLRAYVRVPQTYAPSIHAGDEATLAVPEFPNRTFKARVIADARAIDPTSGTTLVQLLVDNPDGYLMPSSYATVRFELPSSVLGLRVPAEALVFDAQGLRVATLDAGGRVSFKRVAIRRDYGKSVELASGLEPTDRVIINPPDGLVDGDPLRIAGDVHRSDGTHAAP